MEDEKFKKIKEYLKLRKIEEENNSIEMIKEVYKEIVNNSDGVNKNE